MGAQQLPPAQELRTILGDICSGSDADISLDKMTFTLTGSDDAVKEAMNVLSTIPFISNTQHQIRVKIELANEHKEFVSGKKNGKINKIMTQSKSLGNLNRIRIAADIHHQAMFRSSLIVSESTTLTSMS